MSTFADEFENKLKIALQSKNINGLFDIIVNDEKSSSYWKNNCWSYTHLIYEEITHENYKSCTQWVDACEKILQLTSENGTPEEALLEFIERIELAKDDKEFITIIRLLKNVLIRVQNKRERTLEWTFTAIKRYIRKMDCPENYSLEGDEKLLLDSDESVHKINGIYDAVINFTNYFVNEEFIKTVHGFRELCVCFLVQILDKPFSALNLENKFHAKSKSRLLAEEIMALLSKLITDKIAFLNSIPRNDKRVRDVLADSPEEEFITNMNELPLSCLGVFYYLLFSENIEFETIPCVYSPIFILQQGLHMAIVLMKEIEEFIIHKGLLLSHSLIKLVPTMSHDVLDSNVHAQFIQILTNIMIHCTMKEYRILAKDIFDLYYDKFTIKGRYLLMTNIFQICKHSGLLGLLVSKYKDSLIAHINMECIPSHLKGSYLKNVLIKFGALSDGARTDLMIISDQILALLNFLIYLYLRDNDNRTGIWDITNLIRNEILSPLKNAIELSKAHYDIRKKDIIDNQVGMGDGDIVDKRFSVTIGGETLSHLSTPDQLTAIDSALNGFDLMESLRVRVNECIDTKIHSVKNSVST